MFELSGHLSAEPVVPGVHPKTELIARLSTPPETMQTRLQPDKKPGDLPGLMASSYIFAASSKPYRKIGRCPHPYSHVSSSARSHVRDGREETAAL